MSNKSSKEALLSYQLNGESASYATITAVAAVSDTPIAELEPLFRIIDPEALDELINKSSEASISFQYEDYSVSVSSDEVVIRE